MEAFFNINSYLLGLMSPFKILSPAGYAAVVRQVAPITTNSSEAVRKSAEFQKAGP